MCLCVRDELFGDMGEVDLAEEPASDDDNLFLPEPQRTGIENVDDIDLFEDIADTGKNIPHQSVGGLDFVYDFHCRSQGCY